MAEIVSLIMLDSNETGEIVGIQGGQGRMNNLESLGIKIGNKIDLRDKVPNALPPEVGYKYAELASQKIGITVPYIETSAATGENIDKAFEFLIKAILEFISIKLAKKA